MFLRQNDHVLVIKTSYFFLCIFGRARVGTNMRDSHMSGFHFMGLEYQSANQNIVNKPNLFRHQYYLFVISLT